MQNSDSIGKTAEELAARYLEYKGYQILERRFRCRSGEIDIIARDNNTIVFVEVKYRSTLEKGRPVLSVSRSKQHKIYQTALLYLQKYQLTEIGCRFDIVELWQENGRRKVHHYLNAFEGERNGI